MTQTAPSEHHIHRRAKHVESANDVRLQRVVRVRAGRMTLDWAAR